jgi:chemotaxis protein methyltransferase CheR
MAFDAESLGLQPAALLLLRDLVHERLGLYYANDRTDALADRLAPLVAERGFASFLDYFYFLKYDEDGDGEWTRVMDALSVPETYFWREVDQIRAVARIIIPRLLASTLRRSLRIWSVPCASGEEPLTIAMVLEEEGWFDRASVEIHAGDASAAALARARRGVYRERAFRALPDALRRQYFRRCGDGWHVDQALHARVTSWRRINLMDPAQLALVAHSDIVFCRNLFIYFSEDGVRRVVSGFAREMPDPAYLCIGAAESLLRITTAFDLQEVGGAFVYVKREAAAELRR